jgi:hypothetical protein
MSPRLVLDFRMSRKAPPSADRPSAYLSKGAFWRESGTLRFLPILQTHRASFELRSAVEERRRKEPRRWPSHTMRLGLSGYLAWSR